MFGKHSKKKNYPFNLDFPVKIYTNHSKYENLHIRQDLFSVGNKRKRIRESRVN